MEERLQGTGQGAIARNIHKFEMQFGEGSMQSVGPNSGLSGRQPIKLHCDQVNVGGLLMLDAIRQCGLHTACTLHPAPVLDKGTAC